MKKITLLLVLLVGLFAVDSAYSQATSQLNFGLIGVAYDIPVAENVAISPFAGTNFNLDWLTLGVKGNYYFDNIIGMTDPWDFYAGANLGYGIGIGNDNDGDIALGLQVGGRWFWNEKWGLYLELGGGNLGGTGGLGLTMRL
jgi:hypothetical protein